MHVSRQVSTTDTSDPKRRFRLGGLDGIRALAAVAVLLYHTWPGIAPGGFLGVDVFFVLSGFLITSLLIEDGEAFGTIRLKRFWLRRWRRLFPAVVTVVLFTLPIALALSSDMLARARSQVAGTLTFTYNWVALATGSSYFDRANPRLYTNMWTLAVEQQFYLIWPLAMLALWKLHRRARLWVTIGLAAVSVALMQTYILIFDEPSRAYLGTDSHAFGLMAGGALALAIGRPLYGVYDPEKRGGISWLLSAIRREFIGIFSWVALAALIACFVFISEDSPATYPWLTLIAVVCTLVLIYSMTLPVQYEFTLASVLRVALDSYPMRWLGERSYGLYLWHWPLLVIWRAAFPAAPLWAATLVVLAASVVAAALSFRFVENPMRYGGIFATLRRWFSWSSAASQTEVGGGDGARPIFVGASLLRGASILALVGVSVAALVQAPAVTSLERDLARVDAKVSTNDQAPEQSDKGDDAVTPEPAPEEEPLPEEEPAPPEANRELVGSNITILGDSVIKAISEAAAEQWPGVIVDGEVSRSQWTIAPLIEQYLNAGTLGHYVVVGSANNGEMSQSDIDNWLQLIGPHRVLVLVTGHGDARTTWIPLSNEAIAAAAEAAPKRVAVADWSAVAEAHPEGLYADLTHPNEDGKPLFMEELKAALERASKL